MPTFPPKGGSLGSLATIPVGKKVSSDQSEHMDKQRGAEIKDGMGNVYRLVRLNVAAGVSSPGRLAFAWSTPTDAADRTYDVELAVLGGTAPINRVCGFAVPSQVALVDNDYFWLHCDGPYIEAILGDDGTDLAVGEYVQIDDDTDKGKLKTSDTTFSAEFTLGTSLDTDTGTDANIRFIPIRKLNG